MRLDLLLEGGQRLVGRSSASLAEQTSELPSEIGRGVDRCGELEPGGDRSSLLTQLEVDAVTIDRDQLCVGRVRHTRGVPGQKQNRVGVPAIEVLQAVLRARSEIGVELSADGGPFDSKRSYATSRREVANAPATAATPAYNISSTRPAAGASRVPGSCPVIAAAAAPGA
jgi:hypothetical protein